MRKLIPVVLGLALIAVLGCGSSPPPLNTAPLTDEQKREIKEKDQKIDEEENAANTKRRNKKS